MAKLRTYSLVVLIALMALVYAVGLLVFTQLKIPMEIALPGSLIFAVGIVFLQYLIAPYLLDWILKVRWIDPTELGDEFAQWYYQTCRQFRIRTPRLGMIEDGMPNAFTYGHGPWNGRVVITAGLTHILDPDELKSVVAHELGHIKHLDFIMMTIIQALVLVLWTFYMMARGRDRGAWYVVLIAYIGYWLSYLISLLFSRVREYMADYASAQIMRSGNPLSRALVKVAYGLAHTVAVSEASQTQEEKQAQPSGASLRAVGAMGIASPAAIRSAIAWQGSADGPDHRQFVEVALWDLYNPWAKVVELISTHPLVAHRVKALQRLNALWREPNEYDFSQIQPARYQYLTHDLILLALPWLGLLAGLGLYFGMPTLGGTAWKWLLPIVGFLTGYLVRLLMVYPIQYAPAKVIDLLTDVQVSHLKARPVVVEGTLTGRLEAGFFWANDFIVQDETGFIATIYRQPFGALFETLFGILYAPGLIGSRVRIYGWYRRFGAPYVEIDRFEVLDGAGQRVFRCYWRPFSIAMTILAIVALLGLGLMFG